MRLLFPLLFIAVLALMHYYVYKRVVQKLTFSHRIKKSIGYFLLLNLLGVASYMFARYAINMPSALYFLLSLSIGVGFILFVGAIIYDILHFLHRLTPLAPERREFLKKSIDTSFMTAGAVYLGIGINNGTELPKIKPVTVATGSLQKPIKIAQISDLHIGGLVDKHYVQGVVERINLLEADIVAITGDIIDIAVDLITPAVDVLQDIRAKHGVFYVVGNHEYFHGVQKCMDYIEKLGITVLKNDSRTLSINGEKIQIAGVYDIFGYRAEAFEPSIKQIKAQKENGIPTILLAHQPKYLYELQESGFLPELTLSGHTHGGQIFPFGVLVRLVQPFLKGLHQVDKGKYMYVNVGSGFWGPPMRVGADSEITAVTFS